MSFPWIAPTPRGDGAARRLDATLRELRARAGTYFRLGHSVEQATARLAAAVAWEFDPAGGAHRRPAALTDAAIATLVRDTYARRPA